MLVPYEFARIALKHGTVATVSDPHEIANVLGVKGVEYMIENARDALLKFYFGAPSCVPATDFESTGAKINAEEVRKLLGRKDIHYLSEMMNYPGVLCGDPEVMAKIKAAREMKKPVDGHAPGLRDDDAEKYIRAGIHTDHECYSIEEALDKLKFGMKVIIREGSAAKNYDALHPLIKSHAKQLMFCSDDKHPDDLLEGHINQLVKRSLAHGYDLFDVLNIACKNPVEHYSLDVGLLREGDKADFILVDNIENFKVIATYINGQRVCDTEKCILKDKSHSIVNQFNIESFDVNVLKIRQELYNAPIIQALDGALITEKLMDKPLIVEGHFESDIEKDILKIAVLNRFKNTKAAVGFINNFGIKNGAIASTVAHDSHNIICVGSDDHFMQKAIDLLIKSKGGLSAVNSKKHIHLSLPIAGLMSYKTCEEMGELYSEIDQFVKSMGSDLRAPFMTLSFMALLVIPKIKMSDKGIFDAETFSFYR